MTESSASPDDLRRYVEQTAAALGLPIAAEDMLAVVAIFANLASVAAPLMEFPLPEDAEPAPVFTAESVRR